MVNESEDLVTVEELAKCPRCGKLRNLVDLRLESKRLGLSYPENQLYYSIECCGFDLTIEDDEMYRAVVAYLLKAKATN